MKKEVIDSQSYAKEAEVISFKTKKVDYKKERVESEINARETRYSEGFFKKLEQQCKEVAAESSNLKYKHIDQSRGLRERCKSAASLTVRSSVEDLRKTYGSKFLCIQHQIESTDFQRSQTAQSTHDLKNKLGQKLKEHTQSLGGFSQ